MNELARAAGGDGRPPETRAYAATPEVGLIPLIGRGVRRLLGSGSLAPPAVEVPAPKQETGQVSGSHRSAMDAGVTGGMALLTGGPRDSGHPG